MVRTMLPFIFIHRMKPVLLFLLLFPISLFSQIVVDKAGDGWHLKADSALQLIQTYDSAKYDLLTGACEKIEFWNGSYSTNDGTTTIVISVGDVKLNSINNLAAVIVHESLHLYFVHADAILDVREEENRCYRYELDFIERLPDVEPWLWAHTLEQIIATE